MPAVYLAAAHDDHAAHRRIIHRVTDLDVGEPFTANRFLAVISRTHAVPADDRHHAHWLSRWQARRLARGLLQCLIPG